MKLEQCCREDLDEKSSRAMCVTEPLRVSITNFQGQVKDIIVPNHPRNSNMGNHTIPFSGTIYIEQSDFLVEPTPGYKRLTLNKTVGLVHANCSLTCNEVIVDANGKPRELKATVDWNLNPKGLGFIHWVAEASPGQEPLVAEVRIYEKLFLSEDPASLDNWLADMNPNSLTVIPKCYLDPSVIGARVGSHMQFERVGYFCVDPDSTKEKLVWNRVVSLKEANWEK